MARQLLINAAPWETRVALLEDTTLVELHIERRGGRGIAGNVYKGRVIRVLPGMQAAFLDLGLENKARTRGRTLSIDRPLPRRVFAGSPVASRHLCAGGR